MENLKTKPARNLRATITSVTDTFSKARRSWVMSRIRGTDTRPEMIVRSFLHRQGFRFRVHVTSLPGKPDIVLPKHNCVVFVHGCFWHHHKNCPRASMPASRRAFWMKKILGNAARDQFTIKQLRKMGWNIVVIWQCELRNPQLLGRRLASLLKR
jgi:DNA mismatch endonuclease, patch repair protein